MKDQDKMDLVDVPEYWRGLGELEGSEEHTKWLEDEFPHRSSLKDVDRRTFLKMAGATALLSGLAGCRAQFMPREKLVPYVKAPEDRLPGATLYYATAVAFQGYGFGVLARSYEGRPIKLEGNPSHPDSLGSTDTFVQAEILNLYDPDRAQSVMHRGLFSTWEEFLTDARQGLAEQNASKGAGIRILTESFTSPTQERILKLFFGRFPQAKWCQFDAAGADNALEGSRLAFRDDVEVVYDLANADVILSLDADFLASAPRWVRATRDYSKRRRIEDREADLNRLYMVESSISSTGAAADHRVPVSPSEVEHVARVIAARLGNPVEVAPLPAGITQKWVDEVVADLISHKGRAVVIAGEYQSPAVHALAAGINEAIGAVGQTVRYVEPVKARPAPAQSLRDLVQDINSNKVELLLILGGNPVYGAPADIPLAEALPKVKRSVKLGLMEDETSKLCAWSVPESHSLEAWGDLRGRDGTATIVQPLIMPLYTPTRSTIEVLAALLGLKKDAMGLVQDTWRPRLGANFAKKWEVALNNGVIPNSESPAKQVELRLVMRDVPKAASGVEAAFIPDPTIFDGRYANNGWLQEMPKPMTKLTWDNAVHMSPKMANELGVKDEQNVEVKAAGQSVIAPAFIVPGHPERSVTLHQGYGRAHCGKVGMGTGFNFMKLRTSAFLNAGVVTVAKANGTYPLASAQMHHSMEGRDIIREGSLATFAENPRLLSENHHELPEVTLYNQTKEWAKEGLPQWGMTIDLDKCVGCNACAMACQSENNIPTVGKLEVQRGRELHWIRIDRYYKVAEGKAQRDVGQPISDASIDSGKRSADVLDSTKITTHFMPVPCMHCETAPCEPVCPVAATVHSHEGLNQMVYNRCVGTRYCSNNCPYKVRRFNYFNYQHGAKNLDRPYGNTNFVGEKDVPLLTLLSNPDVTVRSRGVMEKCTYCVQRINTVRIHTKKERRDIKDGEVVTACQQACPSQAITFGNIADEKAKVTMLKKQPRNYGLLTDLNTHPRTTYLGRLRNPNPRLVDA